jgi:GNAT superfamily N-acetyltransferase
MRMSLNESIKVGPLQKSELAEAGRIVRLAFGTFLRLPNPLDALGDRDFMGSRWGSPHTKHLAARVEGRLVGSNIATRWGSFGFFGPLTVLPEYWERGVAQRLLEATIKTFDAWGVRRSGLYTFPHSARHVGLYQKFGYWPRYLTAMMTRTPVSAGEHVPVLLSSFGRSRRAEAIEECRKLTNKIERGLDLTGELRAVLAKRTGDVVLAYTRATLDAFAVCMNGAGSEGGAKVCYIKFGAARPGSGAGQRFERLLDACDAFAFSRGANLEGGVNLAREDAFHRMRAHGYRAVSQGVQMQRPNEAGWNRADAYVIDDWR